MILNFTNLAGHKQLSVMKYFSFPTLCIIILFFSLISCENDSNTDDCGCPAKVSAIDSARQLSFIISVGNDIHGYINTEKIDSIKIILDGTLHITAGSDTIDATGETQTIYNNIPFVQSKREYLVMVPGKLDTTKSQTISDYVGLLDRTPVLAPGDHIIEVAEIRFKNLNAQWVVLKPQLYKGFTVTANTKEIFIGSFEISYNE